VGKHVVLQNYHSELCRAMGWLAKQPNVFFIGQGVGGPGTSMSDTLVDVPPSLRVEFPVAEEMQVGLCVGASLRGFTPVCILPRWNFALRAADQLINHMDRLPIYSAGGYRPKVLIRVAAPSTRPFNPGPQHDDDFTDVFLRMCRTVRFYRLDRAETIFDSYRHALQHEDSSILIEYTDQYKDARATSRS
jgi:pyruvate/2-oxoglutarate/acetoin dehydrogenase E1 component